MLDAVVRDSFQDILAGVESEIGEGSYGSVQKARNKGTDQIRAVKSIPKVSDSTTSF